MSKLFACLINQHADPTALTAVAMEFAYRIELLDDGVLFDVSGLEKLIGSPAAIRAAILETMQSFRVTGNLAIDSNLEKSLLLARHGKKSAARSRKAKEIEYSLPLFDQLPLTSLPLETEFLEVFQQLGIREIRDLQKIPAEDLITRYGRNFVPILDLINENSRRTLVPNLKDECVFWETELETAIADFEQLMFLAERLLTELFAATSSHGYSTELIEICLILDNEALTEYEVRSSRPTLDKSFWLKLIYLRVSAEPPAAAIKYVKVTVRFTRPRPTTKGLFAVTRPEPESLLLTVNKLKKLLGKENVGVPVLLNQRLPVPFELNAEKMPDGVEKRVFELEKPLVGFSYYFPPLPAEVLIRRKELLYLKTSRFAGRVAAYSGVWKKSSRWWNQPWKNYEWDVELENRGVYRLCRRLPDWFVVGEYD